MDKGKERRKKYYFKHRKEIINRRKHYEKIHKPFKHLQMQKRRIELKKKVIQGYGGKCKCCEEKLYGFLTIDHINGGNRNDKNLWGKKLKHKNLKRLYLYIIKNNFPKEYQILCYNCNCSKGVYGRCYHKLRR